MDVNFTVLAATSVLGDLIDKCPPAEACRDAFERMSNATVKMCQSAVGFGSQVTFTNEMQDDPPLIPHFDAPMPPPQSGFQNAGSSRPPPTFDYNLKDLFPEDVMQGRSLGGGDPTDHWQPAAMQNSIPTQQQYPYSHPAAPASSSSSTTTPASHPYPQSLHHQPYDPRLIPPPQATSYPIYTFPPSSSSDPPTFDFDLLMNPNPNPSDPTTQPYTSTPGANDALPFDPSLWDEGAQMPDLFSGFFFGGAGDGGFLGGAGEAGLGGFDMGMEIDGGGGGGWGAEGEGGEEEEEGGGEGEAG